MRIVNTERDIEDNISDMNFSGQITRRQIIKWSLTAPCMLYTTVSSGEKQQSTRRWIHDPPNDSSEKISYLDDIKKHLPANYRYNNLDKMTWAHESVHEINSIRRNQLTQKYHKEYNSAYFLGNWTYISPEIKQITLDYIAKRVPEYLKGMIYKTYLIDQQRYWNNQPLYLLDEFSAYSDSVFVGDQEKMPNDRILSSMRFSIEMWGYLEVLNCYLFAGQKLSCMSFIRKRIDSMCKMGDNKWVDDRCMKNFEAIKQYIEYTTVNQPQI